VGYVRTVKTASGATAVQIVYSTRRGSRTIEHLGSAHDEKELAALKAAARQRLARGQGMLDLGLDAAAAGSSGRLPSCRRGRGICGTRCAGPRTRSASPKQPAATWCSGIWCWPGSSSRPAKLDSLRVLSEVGIDPASYATLKRRLPVYAEQSWRQRLAAACAQHAALNIDDPTPEFVIGAYHRLFQIETSFRMSKHDLRARPIYHHKRDSIEAHLSVVFAALALTRLVEDRTGWSIKRFVRTARRCRTVQIRAGQQILTAEDPLAPDLRDALSLIN
jgi:hypothetical protein